MRTRIATCPEWARGVSTQSRRALVQQELGMALGDPPGRALRPSRLPQWEHLPALQRQQSSGRRRHHATSVHVADHVPSLSRGRRSRG